MFLYTFSVAKKAHKMISVFVCLSRLSDLSLSVEFSPKHIGFLLKTEIFNSSHMYIVWDLFPIRMGATGFHADAFLILYGQHWNFMAQRTKKLLRMRKWKSKKSIKCHPCCFNSLMQGCRSNYSQDRCSGVLNAYFLISISTLHMPKISTLMTQLVVIKNHWNMISIDSSIQLIQLNEQFVLLEEITAVGTSGISVLVAFLSTICAFHWSRKAS